VCDALSLFLEFTGRWDELLALSRDAETLAVVAGDYYNAGRRAYQAGWVRYLRGQSGEVLACADRAEAHSRDVRDGNDVHGGERFFGMRALAMQLRGYGHQLGKQWPAAIAAFREALRLQLNSGRPTDVFHILNALASAERDSAEFASAERNYGEALQIARALEDQDAIAGVTGNLAGLAMEREDWPRAEVLARQALSLAEQLGRLELIAVGCRRLAQALVRLGKKEEALPHARRAVEIHQKLGSRHLTEALQTLAECES
jgi:tetratricopeptide (TPR) repeat protein